MPALDTITKELKRLGKTQKSLMEYLGISPNVFTEWNGGRSNSYEKHLPRIAAFLGCSVDYLAGNTLDPLGHAAYKKTGTDPDGPSPEALRQLYALMTDLTEEECAEVQKFVGYVRSKRTP